MNAAAKNCDSLSLAGELCVSVDAGLRRRHMPQPCSTRTTPIPMLSGGEDFWMTSSSFNCTPGLPILHSRDLVNWTLVNHALKNLPANVTTKVQPAAVSGRPSLRFHAGKFWIFFPLPDEGIYVTTADDPAWTLERTAFSAGGQRFD